MDCLPKYLGCLFFSYDGSLRRPYLILLICDIRGVFAMCIFAVAQFYHTVCVAVIVFF